MKKDNIYYNALRLAIPIMLQSAVTNAVGLVDNMMIGNLGTEGISTVFFGARLSEYAIFDTSRRRKDRGYIFV